MPKLKALKNSTAKSRKEKDIEKEATAFFLYSRVEDIEFMLSPKPKNFEDDVPNPNIRIAIQALPQPDVERNEFVLGIITKSLFIFSITMCHLHISSNHI